MKSNQEIQDNPSPSNMKTPVNKKTKKKRLKKVLKSANKSNLSFSFLNSSAVKQSLRANNRALALNLQRCRHELKLATQENVELQKTIKELEMRVLTLERVAGLKDAEIEAEVQRRLQETAMSMIESEVQQAVMETYRKLKDMLVSAGQSLSEAASSITSALNECIETPRRSTLSSFRSFRRGTSTCSLGSIGHAVSEDDMGSPSEARLSTHAIHVPESDLPLQGLPPESMQFQSHDISVIMEQPSIMMEDSEPYLPDRLGDIHSVPEEMTEDEISRPSSSMKNRKKGLSKLPLPQRVPRKDHNLEETTEKQVVDRASSGTSISIPASKSDSVLVVGKDSCPAEDDRRKTFLVPTQKNTEKLQKSPPSLDRRGTFVVQKMTGNEKEDALPSLSQTDRRGTFILPQKSSECSVLPEVKAPEGSEHTMIFNTDMEMTEVIDSIRPISCNVSPVSARESESLSGSSPDSGEIRKKLEELKKKSQRETAEKDKNDKTENDAGSSNKKTGNEASDVASKSAVECRVTKPGKIVFSATRKDLDGFRKPVPIKKPKSKSTIKLSKGSKPHKEQMKTPVKPASVFDFHDKTPNINAGKPADVYNISMDESGVGINNSTKKGTEAEPAEKDRQEGSNKGKSRSRTRDRKNDGSSESDDRNEKKVTETEHAGNDIQEGSSKGKSRSRTRERKNNESSNEESPEKSRSQKNEESGTIHNGAEIVDGMIYHLPLKGCTPEKPVRNTRGRSRSRGRQSYKDFFEESDAESPSETSKRSKSRSKKRVDEDKDFVVKSKARSKSKGPVCDSEELEEKLNTRRSKSRARSCTRATEDEKSEDGVSIKNKQGGLTDKRTNEERSRSPDLKVRSRSRGRSRTRKVPLPRESDSQGDDDIELQAENNQLSKKKMEESPEVRSRAKSRGRSRSRKASQKIDLAETENEGEEEIPVRSLRSKSRTRLIVQSSSEEGDGQQETNETIRSRSHDKVKGIGKTTKRSKSRTTDPQDTESDEKVKETENLMVPDSDESLHLIEDEEAPNVVLPSSDENIDITEKKVRSTRKKSISRKKSICLNSSDDCIDLESLRKSVNRINGKTDKENSEIQTMLESHYVGINPDLAKKPQSSRKRKKSENRDFCKEKDEGTSAATDVSSFSASVSERLGTINVRDRTREAPFINDEELTFSDFDKMYQAKRTLSDYEKEKEERENAEKKKQSKEVEEKNKHCSSKSTKKRKHPKTESSKICETPKTKVDSACNLSDVPVNHSGKAKSKGSSKKKKESTEKENTGQSNTEMSFVDKLKLLKERMSTAADRDKSEEGSRESIPTGNKVLGDVGNQMSGYNTPAPSQRNEFEPSAKRSCRGVKKDYKEISLNTKLRREDFMK